LARELLFAPTMTNEIALDDEKILRLLHIDEELLNICQWLSQQRETAIVARLIPLTNELTRLLDELGLEKA
jgi:hypothetical protein